MNMASYKELYRADASKSTVQYHRYPEGVLRVSFSGAHIIISEVTPRSHNRGPEYCLLSRELGGGVGTPRRKEPTKDLRILYFWGPTAPRFCGSRMDATVAVWVFHCDHFVITLLYAGIFLCEVHSYSASQELAHILRNPWVYHRVRKNPPLIPVLSHKVQSTLPSPLPSRPVDFFNIYFNIPHLHLVLPSGPLLSGFPTKLLCEYLISPIRAACPPFSFFNTAVDGRNDKEVKFQLLSMKR